MGPALGFLIALHLHYLQQYDLLVYKSIDNTSNDFINSYFYFTPVRITLHQHQVLYYPSQRIKKLRNSDFSLFLLTPLIEIIKSIVMYLQLYTNFCVNNFTLLYSTKRKYIYPNKVHEFHCITCCK